MVVVNLTGVYGKSDSSDACVVFFFFDLFGG